MRMHSRRWHLRAIAALGGGLGSVVSAACAGAGAGSGQQPVASSTGCRAAIEVWGYGIGGDVMKKLVADYTAANPACTISATDQADDANGTVQAKLTTAQVGGAPPTLTGLSPSRFRTWTDPGLIADVDEL